MNRRFAAPGSVIIGGVACILGTGAVATLFPSLRTHEAKGTPPAPAQ